jgi:hypothetical protein
MEIKEVGHDRGRIENGDEIVRGEAVWMLTTLRGSLS